MSNQDEKQGANSSTGSPSFPGSISSSFGREYKTGSGAKIDGLGAEQTQIDFEKVFSDFSEVAMAKLHQRIDELYRLNQTTIGDAQRKTIKLLDKSTDILNESAKRLADNETALEESKKLQEMLAADINSIKGSAVSALSIFVSFFAFITVSINVFSKATDVFSGASLVAVFWCLLFGFNVLIGIQMGTFQNGRKPLLWIILSVILSFSIIAALYFHHLGIHGIMSPLTIST